MNSPSATSLARVWADATPLAKYLADRAEQLCRDAPAIAYTHSGDKPSTVEQMTVLMQYHANMQVARGTAQTAIANELIAGRLVALGRPSVSYDFERIDPSFWIGAKIEWGSSEVSRDDATIVDVRIARPEDIPAVQPKLYEVAGRPSKSDVITAAISEYAKKDPTLSRPPLERRGAYYEYISARGYNPRREKGFDEKTIQKYELIFRRKNM